MRPNQILFLQIINMLLIFGLIHLKHKLLAFFEMIVNDNALNEFRFNTIINNFSFTYLLSHS